MNEVLTLILVIITAFYSWVTFKILKANRSVVELMAEQSEALTRPYVTVTVFIPPERPIFRLRICNTGRTAAHNLTLKLDKEFCRYNRNQDGSRLSEFAAFNDAISTFPPGAELLFDLAQSFYVFGGDDIDKTNIPAEFTITATYSYSNKSVAETNIVDMRPYRTSNPPYDPVVNQLKNIAEAVEKSSTNVVRALEKK